MTYLSQNRFFQALISAGFVGALTFTGLPAKAEEATEASLTGNIAVSSDYVWRGVSQNDGDNATAPSVSGGLDFAAGGFYAGTWISTVNFDDESDAEIDYYIGYNHVFDQVTLDVSYVMFTYPGAEPAADFEEIVLGLEFGGFSVSAAMTVSADSESYDDISPTYIALGYSFALPQDWELGLHAGMNSYDWVEGIEDDVADISLSLSKGGFSYSIFDHDSADDTRFVVSYGLEF